MDLLNPDADDPEFFARWNEWYQDVPPLGSMLREDYPERWLRIHSLPESKRYPDSDSEYAELLVRQNAAATAVLGPDAHCILVLFARAMPTWAP